MKFVVIGLGRFGYQLAVTLTQAGAEVIAIDEQQHIIEEIRDKVTVAVRLDSADEEALIQQGIQKVDAAVVGIGSDFEAAILTVSNLKSFGIPRIICRCESERRGQILIQVGATTSVNPEAESALRWAHRLMLPDLRDYIELGEGYSIVQVAAPPLFHDKTPGSLDLRQAFGINLIAIKRPTATAADDPEDRDGGYQTYIPDRDTRINSGDILVLVGSDKSLEGLPRH